MILNCWVSGCLNWKKFEMELVLVNDFSLESGYGVGGE